jgi:hypothetical protein
LQRIAGDIGRQPVGEPLGSVGHRHLALDGTVDGDRGGAGELLDRVARDGFAGDVDWRLVAYSLSRADAERLPPDGFAIGALSRHHALIDADRPLAAYCFYPALLQPGRVGSVRKADNIVE